MPPKKKQKTSKVTDAPSKEKEQESSEKHKEPEKEQDENAPPKRDVKTIPDDEYVCKERPFYDYKLEAGAPEDEDEEEAIWKKFQDEHNAMVTSDKMFQKATDRPDWKWVMLWSAWKTFRNYESRADYCDPDKFSMYIYNDFCGYGMAELLENLVLEFDAGLKKEKDGDLKIMWGIVSAIALWLVEVDQMHFMGSDDSNKTKDLCILLGTALLRALAAIDHAGDLKPDTPYLDIPIVITTMLDWSSDLEDYGIEAGEFDWRAYAIAYYQKAKFEESRGIANTAKIFKSVEAERVKEDKLPAEGVKDPWGWANSLRKYKKKHAVGGKIGGRKYDITKMTRKERAKHSFSGKDPLEDIPESALKNDELDLGG